MNTGLPLELSEADVGFEVIEHRRTHTAGEEARVLGVAPGLVGKTIVLHTSEGYVRTVIPASRRLDLQKARRALVDRHARLATETELAAAYPMFELGAVPPLSGPPGDRVLLDRRIVEHDTVIVEAGTHDESVRMHSATLLTLGRALVADLCRR